MPRAGRCGWIVAGHKHNVFGTVGPTDKRSRMESQSLPAEIDIAESASRCASIEYFAALALTYSYFQTTT